MSRNSTLGYMLSIIGSIGMIFAVIIALYVNFLLWNSTGSLSDPTYFHLQLLLITWGIIMPSIALEMSILGAIMRNKSEYISLLVGIVLITLVILITFMLGYQVASWYRSLPSVPSEALNYNLTLIILNVVGIGIQVVVLIGAINLIAYSRNPNK